MMPTHACMRPMLSLLALLSLSSTAIAQTTHIVTVGDNFFSPSSLTIQVGDTVEWRNAAGGMPHDVTANDGSFASVTASSFTFSHTFTSAGTWNYRCTVHPASMTGVITVEGAAAQAELELQEVSVAAGSYPQGSVISIDAEVENTGTASSGTFSIRHYASTNTSITAEDVLLGTESRASLPAGENSHGPFSATIPVDLPPGTYFIGSIIQFSDSNGSNNTNFEDSAITVTESAAFKINAGMNDAWYDPATDGQGFFVVVFPDLNKLFLSWFTYDVERPPPEVTAVLGEPGHRWLTAIGDISGDTAVLDVDVASGGVFDSGEPAPTHQPDGTITIQFSDCAHGEVLYDITSAGVSGSIPIQRIVNDNVILCEALSAP